MNVVDYILIGVVSFYTLFGFIMGLMEQLLGLLGVMFSLLAGYLFYQKTGNFFLSPIVVIIVGIIFKIIVSLIKKMCSESKSEKSGISFTSRIGGGLIGAFKGAVSVFIALLCISLFLGIFNREGTAISEKIEGSFFYSYVNENNSFSNIEVIRNIYFAGKLLKENHTIVLQENDEVVRKLKENPSFNAIVNDPALRESIQNKDYKKVLSNANFRKLLNDKDFLKQICNIDYEAIYKEQTNR